MINQKMFFFRELTHKCPIGDKMHDWAFQIKDWVLEIGDWGIGWNWLECIAIDWKGWNRL